MRTETPEQPLSPRSETPITAQEKIALAFQDLEERVSWVEGLGRQIAGNIDELKTALKEIGHSVPIPKDRKIHDPGSEDRSKQAATLQNCQTLLKERSLVNIIENGLAEDGILVSSLAADEEWMALTREFYEHWRAIKDLCKSSEEMPLKEFRDKIGHDTF